MRNYCNAADNHRWPAMAIQGAPQFAKRVEESGLGLSGHRTYEARRRCQIRCTASSSATRRGSTGYLPPAAAWAACSSDRDRRIDRSGLGPAARAAATSARRAASNPSSQRRTSGAAGTIERLYRTVAPAGSIRRERNRCHFDPRSSRVSTPDTLDRFSALTRMRSIVARHGAAARGPTVTRGAHTDSSHSRVNATSPDGVIAVLSSRPRCRYE